MSSNLRNDERDEKKRARSFSTAKAVGATVALCAAGVAGVALSRFRVCRPDEVIVKTGLGIKTVWTGRTAVVWPLVQRHQIVPLTPTTHSFKVGAMSKDHLSVDLPIDVVTRPADPYTNHEKWNVYCQNLASVDENGVKRIIAAALEGQLRMEAAKNMLMDIFSGGRAEYNALLTVHVRQTLESMGIDVVSLTIRTIEDQHGFFDAHRTRAMQGAVLTVDAQVAERHAVSAVEQADQKRKEESSLAQLSSQTRTVVAEQDQLAMTFENAQKMITAKSEADLAIMRTEMDRQAKLAQVHATAEVQQEAAVRAAKVQAEERTAKEQMLRATSLAECTVRMEAKEREADGQAYATRVVAEGQASAVRALALADRDAALLRAEGTRAQMQAEADGYREQMLAYGANPELAKFLKGNESGLWAKQAEQAAAALQGLKPEYHVWQSGGAGASKDPLLDLAAQLMPVMQIVGNKMLPAVKATTDALRAS